MIQGAVYAESGQPAEAQEHLKKAEAMFQEMGMEHYPGKTREMLGKL